MEGGGARVPRYDGIEHVTGRTTYVDDVRVPGMLWAKALRSPLHSAAITSFDVSKAEAVPGVHAVITHADVPLLEYGHLSALGIPADEPLLDDRDGEAPLAEPPRDHLARRAGTDHNHVELALVHLDLPSSATVCTRTLRRCRPARTG